MRCLVEIYGRGKMLKTQKLATDIKDKNLFENLKEIEELGTLEQKSIKIILYLMI